MNTKERNISNITTLYGEEKDILSFDTDTIDCILFYDILHGENINRFAILKEAHRVLKNDGILSILPFHLSNFRDENGKMKKYKVEKLIKEISELDFTISNKIENEGIHFEKYHSPHYIRNGGIDFDDLERGTIINFSKIK